MSEKSDIKIICLGDSNTFGLGSSYRNSYPEQLENLLNKEIKNHRFVIYNLGVVGQNSLQVKNSLEKNILTYNPDYIVVLIGVNNRWNLAGRDCDISENLQIEPRNKILSIADNLKLVKLVRLGMYNIKYRLFMHSIFSGHKNKAYAIDNRKEIDAKNELLQGELVKIEADIAKNNITDAFVKTKELSEKYTDNADIHALLGRIYYLQCNYEKGIEEYNRALSLQPNNVTSLHGKALCYRESGNINESLNIYDIISRLEPENKELKMDFRHTLLNSKHKWALSEREQKIMDYWLEQDLSAIIKISLRYSKKLIIFTYPTQNWQDEVRKTVSQAFNIPLVDIYCVFKRLNNISEYLGSCGHPNDKGYYVMAHEVFNSIRKDFN
jgi:lysophospholipase L1-like esterase